MNPGLDNITITFQKGDHGTIVADKSRLERLTEFLRDHGVRLFNSLDAGPGFCSIAFNCPEHQLRDTVRAWREHLNHNIEYKAAIAV